MPRITSKATVSHPSNDAWLRALPASVQAALGKLGIHRHADLLLHFPLRYEDETRITKVIDLQVDEPAQVEVEVLDCSIQYRPRRQLVVRTKDVADGTKGELLILRFLYFYPSQQKALQAGKRLRAFGKLRMGQLGPEMVHPRMQMLQAGVQLPVTLTPIYPVVKGVNQKRMRAMVNDALNKCAQEDTLTADILAHNRLIDFSTAVMTLHKSDADEEQRLAAWQRIKFDELLAQQLSLRTLYFERRGHCAVALAKQQQAGLPALLQKQLPFKLTRSQMRVWAQIEQDLGQSHPMRRLLQGDVGSGKTVLAALALLHAVSHGYQGVLMAPTEVLMEQHFAKIRQWCEGLNISVLRLSGTLGQKEKREVRKRVASTTPLIVVGTHALVEKDLRFARLALAVVDEQHRFGVEQRLNLGSVLGSNDTLPHLLTMSATPIPRTLAMSYCADLDLSTLDEMPPGRQTVLTKLFSQSRRDEVIQRLRDTCRRGRQIYWVCPLIDAADEEEHQLRSVMETHERLTREMAPFSVGLMHGRMTAQEKKQSMRRFVSGEIQVLVATTIIEVGVDVANAAIIVIEHAERFGLAQLHQLRGRVGRGQEAAACILLYDTPLTAQARERLMIILENNDGFEIAKRDLRLRGPGEFLGTRQSGLPLLRHASLEENAHLLPELRTLAEAMLKNTPQKAREHMERWGVLPLQSGWAG